MNEQPKADKTTCESKAFKCLLQTKKDIERRDKQQSKEIEKAIWRSREKHGE